MLLEAVRIVAAAMTHETTGVNAQLVALPLDTNPETGVLDARPDPIKRVLTEVDDHQVALDTDVGDWPVLVVTVDQPGEADEVVIGSGYALKLRVPVTIRYVVRYADAVTKRRHTFYVLRAICRALEQLATDQVTSDRNGVTVELLERVEVGVLDVPNDEDSPSTLLRGAVVGTLVVRDTWTGA